MQSTFILPIQLNHSNQNFDGLKSPIAQTSKKKKMYSGKDVREPRKKFLTNDTLKLS